MKTCYDKLRPTEGFDIAIKKQFVADRKLILIYYYYKILINQSFGGVLFILVIAAALVALAIAFIYVRVVVENSIRLHTIHIIHENGSRLHTIDIIQRRSRHRKPAILRIELINLVNCFIPQTV